MTTHYADEQVTLHCGDALDVLRTLPDESVHCVVTSPPYYGLRDYGQPGQYGLEPTPAAYVETIRTVFAEVRRILTPDGTVWLNLGDSYVSKPPGNVRGVSDRSGLNGAQTSTRYRDRLAAGMGTKADTTGFGLPEKNLIGIPWRVAYALQDDGWILRNAIIWAKGARPEAVQDRLSGSHETVFLLTKRARYWFDLDAVRGPARPDGGPGPNPGDVWTIPTVPFPGAHFATMPPALAERCVRAGCRPGGVVLDPFCGAGTSGMAALRHGRRFVGVDLSPGSLDLALRTRLAQAALITEAST